MEGSILGHVSQERFARTISESLEESQLQRALADVEMLRASIHELGQHIHAFMDRLDGPQPETAEAGTAQPREVSGEGLIGRLRHGVRGAQDDVAAVTRLAQRLNRIA